MDTAKARRISRRALIWGLVIFFMGGLTFWYGTRDFGRQELEPGGDARTAPPLSLKDPQGRVHTLQDLRGSWAILHFWASWCPPCVEELPEFIKLAEGFEDAPVRFVAITNDETWEEAHKILPRDGLPPNVLPLIDPETAFAEKLGSFQLPESYLMNPDGRIVHKWVGPQAWTDEGVREFIRKLVKDTAAGG